MDDLKVEPIDRDEKPDPENTIELERYMIHLRDKRLPLSQQLALINHEIEQTKSKIKIATQTYWQNKQ